MEISSQIQVSVEHQSTFSLAAQQNAFPLFKRIEINYIKNSELQQKPLRNIVVSLQCEDGFFEDEIWRLDEISPGQSITLQVRNLQVDRSKLLELSEEVQISTYLSVTEESEAQARLFEHRYPVSILPHNYWGGEERQPELLAAFVKPNGVYVETLVRQVTELLEKSGHGRSADGYQSDTREKPYLMCAALWNVISAQGLSYVSPPVGFAKVGQRIRLASDISALKNTACLDTSLLFASCIESMGLNPVIALTRGHAFAGAWLIDQRFPVLTNDDPMELRKRVDARDLVFFETTLVTNPVPVTFSEACTQARELIDEERESDFVYVIDIKQARARQIKPLSTVEERPDEQFADKGAELPMPAAPVLPPVRQEDRVVEETPQTRIDMWQRRLLDLTKRNSLLNHRQNAIAIKLYCPDIGLMEDLLADGNKFKFLPASETTINDRERDPEAFRLSSGLDLHKQYALDQMERSVLIANQSASQLEKNSVSLLRKAKNDLEEGGANTLFLALGFLRWRENPKDERSYRAPLILIPVELTRRSASAPIYMKQLQEEQPLFNLTLIEFLQSEYDIDFNQFKDELPEDDSGIDVKLIWNTVRNAISEEKGFEVVEELVLASFSFAKYLMWKDLKDRIDDLKENLFVKHLVDNPHDPYQQDSSFVLQDRVDHKIDPRDIYTPLNCDSSQLVAVEASGRDQDFVLEGPPGTGKSETIANIIAHNIALNRKVLFVAEKMAALNVVYRRLEKIGLDHLCLELHSNKANKKAVLDQLRLAATRREPGNESAWLDRVESLKVKRDQLNDYVKALHDKSVYGTSFRDCVSRSALYSQQHSFRLDWAAGFDTAPARNEAELEEMLEAVSNLVLAYQNLAHLDVGIFKPIKAIGWSFSWQSSIVSKLQKLRKASERLDEICKQMLEVCQLDERAIELSSIGPIHALSTLVLDSVERPLSFALGKGSKDNLLNLNKLCALKKDLDQQIDSIGHNVTYELLDKSPIDDWVNRRDKEGSHWLKGWFVKRKIKKEAVALGYRQFEDFSFLDNLKSARDLKVDIDPLTKNLINDGVWAGWDSSSGQLEKAYETGKKANKALSQAISITENPADILKIVRSHIIEAREFLEESRIANVSRRLVRSFNEFSSCAAELKALNIEFDQTISLETLQKVADELIRSESKFKSWCEWQFAVKEANNYKLENLVAALESRKVLADDAVEQVMTAFCRWLAPQLMDLSPELNQFKQSSHEALIQQFRELDQEVARTTSEYIRQKTSSIKPDFDSKDSPKEFGVLAREFQKKTRHKPVRQLINELGGSLLDLCPCMMMSPMSVAQFLPPDFQGFDLVVFDEASQMTTWDSVGAIARGRHVIVVGDPKQMPPTNFFAASVDPDDPDEEDLESILDQALAARLPHLRLKGHYRSRHETLIAFSNSKYYENSLVTYPSSETKESAVTLHRVNGVYAKGKGRNNPIEAKAVVGEVVRRLKHPQLRKLTLGIVTLNTEQQRTVEDLLDDARRNHPEIEPYFHSSDEYDEVFVKNLESVQGDERDVIMLSLGYGPTEPHGKTMSMNFGPLNKTGGERRLNVAITRATTEVLLFASFDSSMIDLSRTSAMAVEHLKHYLEFGEKGPVALSYQASTAYGVDQFDSDFEQAVAFALRDLGWKVQTQVGVSKFRVDLGILHPDKPGVFLAGVECDGATYHSSPSARDRDRVRHVILENLGWRLVRLWSTEYFVDPETAIKRVHERLEEILAEDRHRAETKELEAEATILEDVMSPSDEVEATPNPAEGKPKIAEYDSRLYFESSHQPVLRELTKAILEAKNGIKLHTLVLEVANLHGLSRTSEKQIKLITKIIKPWAGMKEFPDGDVTVWLSPNDVVDMIPWRGVDAFGDERSWSEIPYPEAIGLAKFACEQRPENPVDFMCEVFSLKRRHEKTIKKFQEWVGSAQQIGFCTPP